MALRVLDRAREGTGMPVDDVANKRSMLGELTDTGRATTLALGERLRKQYIEE